MVAQSGRPMASSPLESLRARNKETMTSVNTYAYLMLLKSELWKLNMKYIETCSKGDQRFRQIFEVAYGLV